MRLGGALAGQVALTRQPVVLNDLSGVAWAPDWQQLLDREGLTAYAALPLVAKGKVLGVMEVLRQQAFESSSDWLETLQTLAVRRRSRSITPSCSSNSNAETSNSVWRTRRPSRAGPGRWTCATRKPRAIPGASRS